MTKGNSRKFLALLAIVAMLSMALVGCGGTDTDEGTEGEGAAEAVTVTIGVGAPLTDGAVALGQGMVRGTKLAVKQANESQELKDLGLTIEVVEGDDKGDPTTGGNVATQFTSNSSLL